ncbi:MAG: hypothetical protein ACYC56_05955 [Candidatus Aquicultor sp.]
MGWRIAIKLAGIGFEVFAGLSLLVLFTEPQFAQDQVVVRAIPYSFLAMSGLGVIGTRQWGRHMVIAVSFVGLMLELREISGGLDIKDVIETLIFISALVFFTREKVGEQFRGQLQEDDFNKLSGTQ